MKIIITFFLLITLSLEAYSFEKKSNVEFSSDKLEIDEKSNIMRATGNVIIKSPDQTIYADKVEYFQKQDKANATGNVLIKNIDGTIIEAPQIILTNEFKSILSLTLFAKFKDNSKIKAAKLVKDNKNSIFINGEYTPCDCDFKNGEKPVWQLNSDTIRHDFKNRTIYFKNVILKILDFPVLYLPFLNYPDPTVRRKKGFLTPSWGYSSRNGLNSSIPYYFVTEDDSWDTTFTNHFKGKNGYINQFNSRKKYNNSSFEANIYQGHVDTNKKNNDDVFAANINFNADLNNEWTVDSSGKYSDQDTFMRRYNLDNSSQYKNYIKANKVTSKSISEIEFYKYDNLDENSSYNQPMIQPSIYHHILDNLNDLSYEIIFKAHDIRDDQEYDIQRWSGIGYLEKSFNNSLIDVVINAETGLDLYAINKRPSSDNNDNRYLDRLSIGFGILGKKDYFFELNNKDLLITPKVQLTVFNSTDRKDDIPNRDSADFRLDHSNLFFINNYQGRDNLQTNQRINYGIDSTMVTKVGEFSFFVGQSKRLLGTEDNILDSSIDKQSDYVSELKWNVSNKFILSYNASLDHNNLKTNYSNFELSGKVMDINYNMIHSSLDGSLVDDHVQREEFIFKIGKTFENWELNYSNKFDLSNNESELLEEEITLDYVGDFMFQDCLSIKLSYKNKDAAPDRDIEPENSIYITLSLKNLGEYGFN